MNHSVNIKCYVFTLNYVHYKLLKTSSWAIPKSPEETPQHTEHNHFCPISSPLQPGILAAKWYALTPREAKSKMTMSYAKTAAYAMFKK